MRCFKGHWEERVEESRCIGPDRRLVETAGATEKVKTADCRCACRICQCRLAPWDLRPSIRDKKMSSAAPDQANVNHRWTYNIEQSKACLLSE
jgi:hypothetical protein